MFPRARALAAAAYDVLDRCTAASPLVTKCGAGAVLAGVGDAAAQAIERRRADSPQPHETERTGRIMLWRAAVHTPIVHFWFIVMDKWLVGPSVAWPAVIQKVLLDQLIASPIVHGLFFPFMAAAEGRRAAEGLRRMRENLAHVVSMSWCFWTFVHLGTFRFVPLRHRVVWMAVLSTTNERVKM
eukprot:TRINITY_DN37478_c0_g1_i2.p1 TRINITY_DN37478_c0_g1~~TRINITY_DN37478_c0_g1_i2.p1  ORF type:complete len:204 (+),score=73.75 TRINITY_DN37478_c0_g1_i2:61-612(+)